MLTLALYLLKYTGVLREILEDIHLGVKSAKGGLTDDEIDSIALETAETVREFLRTIRG